MRRSVVGGMALVMLVALMGTAAAVGSPVLPGGMVDEAGSDGLRDQPQPTPADPSGHARGGAGAEDTEDGDRPFGLRRSQEARRFGQCMRDSGGDRSACDDLKPGPAWTTPGHPGQGRDRAEEPPATEGNRAEGFGLRRSQEARRFGQCMRDSGGDRSACDDLKPGPAWTTPGHPGQGHGRW